MRHGQELDLADGEDEWVVSGAKGAYLVGWTCTNRTWSKACGIPHSQKDRCMINFVIYQGYIMDR